MLGDDALQACKISRSKLNSFGKYEKIIINSVKQYDISILFYFELMTSLSIQHNVNMGFEL